jgi:Cu/Ag efflux pump CusA
VLADVRDRVQAMSFPLEYHAQVLGGTTERRDSDRRTLLIALAAAAGIFLILQAAAGSWRVAALLFGTLPLAAVGGVLAAPAAGGLTSLGALLGLLTAVGIAARSNLVLVRRYQSLDRLGPAPERVLRGTQERFAPVVLTALAVAAALLPFALLGSVAGTEILHPLAVVALGGLVTSTLLTLFVLPALYLRFAGGTAPPGRSAGLDEPDQPTTGDAHTGDQTTGDPTTADPKEAHDATR